jgi:PKD repeat protein
MWLTYIFKEAGNYKISAEIEDTNGNRNKTIRNMIIVK